MAGINYLTPATHSYFIPQDPLVQSEPKNLSKQPIKLEKWEKPVKPRKSKYQRE